MTAKESIKFEITSNHLTDGKVINLLAIAEKLPKDQEVNRKIF